MSNTSTVMADNYLEKKFEEFHSAKAGGTDIKPLPAI